jgi:hypothetical protein
VRLSPVDGGNLILAAAPQPGGQRTGSPRRSFGNPTGAKLLRGAMEGVAILTPGSAISFNRWPARRNVCWRAGG